MKNGYLFGKWMPWDNDKIKGEAAAKYHHIGCSKEPWEAETQEASKQKDTKVMAQ